MILLKSLLLLIALSLPMMMRAQAISPIPILPKPAKTPPTDLESVLQGIANPRYLVLEKPTAVYRQPADTLNGRYIFKLVPGTRVYIRKGLSHGLIITLFYGNGEQYYLLAKSVVGLSTYVEL